MTATREPRCDLTELIKSQCAHCLGHQPDVDAREQLTATEVGPRFTAEYGGRCGVCDGPIRAGDVIARLVDGSGYACQGCLP